MRLPAAPRAAQRVAVVAVVAAISATLGVPALRGAPLVEAGPTPYTLETTALYRVDPRAGRIDVSIDATFTNLAPDPPGGYTIFTEAVLAIHDGAMELRAEDAAGSLAVTASDSEGTRVATVTLRTPIRYGQSASFAVAYALLDGAAAGTRIQPPGTVFTVWGFGTRSRVSVELPTGYDVDVQGDPLRMETAGDTTRLSSGSIDTPGSWAAVVTAGQPGSYVTMRAEVPLQSATADIRVAAWADDEEWGHRTLALLVEALPVLERLIGLPYEQAGPLTVRESVSRSEASLDAQAVQGAEILLGFDQPPFTALHEAAHIWIGPHDIESRWIYEGFASYFAARAALEIGVEPAFDPVAVRDQNTALAFPLDEWEPLGESTDDRDRYGYPASWALAAAIAERAGDAVLAGVLRRVADRDAAYPVPELAARRTPPAAPERTDSRRLLDLLEEASGVAFDDLFARDVFGPDDAALLQARAQARATYRELLTAAAGWGAPLPVVDAMNRWDFATAIEEIELASSWLVERDAFATDLEVAGLEAPDRLAQRYASSGGGEESHAELAAERAVLAAYRDARAEIERPLNAVESVGLLGMSEPDEQLESAAALFERGEIDAATAAIDVARDAVARAAVVGGLRIATLVALLTLALVATVAAFRSRGRLAG